MDAILKPTLNAQKDPTNVDSDCDEREAPKFHIQTGVRAGGFFENFYAWWEGVADGFNMFDRATGAG